MPQRCLRIVGPDCSLDKSRLITLIYSGSIEKGSTIYFCRMAEFSRSKAMHLLTVYWTRSSFAFACPVICTFCLMILAKFFSWLIFSNRLFKYWRSSSSIYLDMAGRTSLPLSPSLSLILPFSRQEPADSRIVSWRSNCWLLSVTKGQPLCLRT